MNAKPSTCDEFYRQSSDPWGFRTRWYERRKREIVVASLTRERFESCWELGCSNGELTAALAPRCDRLLATDGNRIAVDEARLRVREFPHVVIEQQVHPEQWPQGQFELIIFSELGYNFDGPTLRQIARRFGETLLRAGVLLACHWRHPIESCPTGGEEAHEILREVLALPRLVLHEEADFVLELWSADARSVGARDGLL